MWCSTEVLLRAALLARQLAAAGARVQHGARCRSLLAAGAAGGQEQLGCGALAERAASHRWASTSAPLRRAHNEAGLEASHDGHGHVCDDPTCSEPHAHAHAHTHTHAHAHGAPASNSFEEQERACWSCHDRHKRGSLLCQACDKIQPVDSSLTYFDLMGIKEPTFDVDEASLERRYKLLQWMLHPDKAVSRSAEERDFSAAHASHINQAYGVLRRPLSRANYLLMLAGVPAGDNFEGTLEDPELLMEVMEAREQVEGTDDPAALRPLLASAQEHQRRIEGELSAAFKAGDTARAAGLVAALTYYVRLEEAIVAKL